MLYAFYRDAALPANWDLLIHEASNERLLPALAHRSRTLGIYSQLPPEIQEVFNAAETLNEERNQTILAEAVHVATLLNQIGIQPVALKGLAYLLTGVYPDPATRYILDVDLLVAADQMVAAANHLKQYGYFENEPNHLVQFRHHHPALRRPGLPQIELHRRVGQGVCNRLLPAPDLFADSKLLTCKGAAFLIPSPTDLANHLVLHSQLAHSYADRIFPPLRALVDLIQLQNRFGNQIDWPALHKTYTDNHEAATLILHLKHAEDILGVQIPIQQRLSVGLNLRYRRRRVLNAHPELRFIDPVYLLMSVFSRRLRLVPQILRNPSSWPQLFRMLTNPEFYRNLFAV